MLSHFCDSLESSSCGQQRDGVDSWPSFNCSSRDLASIDRSSVHTLLYLSTRLTPSPRIKTFDLCQPTASQPLYNCILHPNCPSVLLSVPTSDGLPHRQRWPIRSPHRLPTPASHAVILLLGQISDIDPTVVQSSLAISSAPLVALALGTSAGTGAGTELGLRLFSTPSTAPVARAIRRFNTNIQFGCVHS